MIYRLWAAKWRQSHGVIAQCNSAGGTLGPAATAIETLGPLVTIGTLEPLVYYLEARLDQIGHHCSPALS
jgi:hypothetical protein